MYKVLIVSGDRGFLDLSVKFMAHIDGTINVIPCGTVGDASSILRSDDHIDVILFDHDADNDVFSMVNSVDRLGTRIPMIMMSRDTSPELMARAIDERIEGFLVRGRSDPMVFFNDVVQRTIVVAERHRTEIGRRKDEKRMEAIIGMTRMSDRDFREVVDFALEKSIELTDSEIGYVGLYDRRNRVVRMMAWSKGAMERCAMDRRPMEFPLDSTGAWGEPIRLGRSVTINDYDNDRRMIKKGVPMGHVQLKRLLMVPIFLNGEVIGTAGVANKKLEYTWSDEEQLNMLMGEMFSIYGDLEATRSRTEENRLIRNLMELSGTGFMFVTTEMDIIMANDVASGIIGMPEDGDDRMNLTSLRTDAAIGLVDTIDRVRRDGDTQRCPISTEDGSDYEMVVSGTVGDGSTGSGFSVVFEDVTEVRRRDDRIDRGLDHIRTLEGPVLNTLMDTYETLEPAMYGADGQAVDRMREAITFMRDYRSVGLNEPQWMSLSEQIDRGMDGVDTAGVEIVRKVGGMRIFADPAFHLVFRNLISNSITHGGCVTRIDISCRIENGDLTIVYRDDGYGISENLRHFLFEQVDNGKFGLYLIRSITSASGFGFRDVEDRSGAVFEITVPPSGYSLG